MKISQILLLLLFGVILLGKTNAADSSEEEDEEDEENDEDGEEEDVQVEKKKVEGEGAKVPNPYIQDPFLFYKWPGVGQQEGIVGRFPWWPLIPYQLVNGEDIQGLKLNGQKPQADIQDDHHKEDDDDHHETFYHDDHAELVDFEHKKKKHHKHPPTAVFSVGVGSSKGKSTPWGVLYPPVNGRTDFSEESEEEERNFYPYPYLRQQQNYEPRYYRYLPEENSLEEEDNQWISSYEELRPVWSGEWRKR